MKNERQVFILHSAFCILHSSFCILHSDILHSLGPVLRYPTRKVNRSSTEASRVGRCWREDDYRFRALPSLSNDLPGARFRAGTGDRLSALRADVYRRCPRRCLLQAILAVVVAVRFAVRRVAGSDRRLGGPANPTAGIPRRRLEARRYYSRSLRGARGLHQRRTRTGLSRPPSRLEHGSGRQMSATGVLPERTGQGRLRAGSGNVGQARPASPPGCLSLYSPLERHSARLRRVRRRRQPGRMDSLAAALRRRADPRPGTHPRHCHSIRLGPPARARARARASRRQAGQRADDQRGHRQGHGLRYGAGARLRRLRLGVCRRLRIGGRQAASDGQHPRQRRRTDAGVLLTGTDSGASGIEKDRHLELGRLAAAHVRRLGPVVGRLFGGRSARRLSRARSSRRELAVDAAGAGRLAPAVLPDQPRRTAARHAGNHSRAATPVRSGDRPRLSPAGAAGGQGASRRPQQSCAVVPRLE